MKRLYIPTIAIIAMLLASLVTSAQSAQPSLVNGELDKPYTRRGADEVMVANGWSDPVWRGRRPEFKPDTVIVRHDESQKWFVRFDNSNAAIGQQPAGLRAGDWVRVSAWVYPWSSQKDDVTRCQST